MSLLTLIFFILFLTTEANTQNLYSYYLLNQELKIISATKEKENLLKTPRYVRVITHDELERLGVKNLFELLDYLPEFYYWRSFFGLNAVGALGLRQSYFSEKIQVLLNGVPISDPSNGSSFSVNSVFPLSNVKQVEIVYGPMTALYGYNTSLAVINLITYLPNDKGKIETSISTGHDSYNSVFIPFKNKTFSGSFSFNYVENRSPHRVYTDFLDLKGNYSSFKKNFDYFLTLNFPSGFYLKSYSVNRDEHFPVTISELITNGNSYARRKSFINKLGYGFSLNNLKGDIYVGYNWFYLKRSYNLCPFNHKICSIYLPSELLAVEKRYLKEPRIGGFFSLSTNEFGKFSFGAEYTEVNLYKTRLNSNFLPSSVNVENPRSIVVFPDMRKLSDRDKLISEKKRYSFSPYIQYNFNFDDYYLLLNLRWNKTNDVGSDWSYTVSLMKKIEKSIFKLNFGRALRIPSFEEMYIKNNPILKGNPNLKLEKVDSIMSSYQYIGDRVTVNLTTYYFRFRNFIYKKQVPGGSNQWDNSDSSVRTLGLITSFKTKIAQNLELRVSFGRVFSVEGLSGEYFDFPKKKLVSGLNYWNKEITSGLYIVAYSKASSRAPGFYRVDYNFNLNLTENSKVFLNVKNLLNRKYQFDDEIPGDERILWVGFQLYY